MRRTRYRRLPFMHVYVSERGVSRRGCLSYLPPSRRAREAQGSRAVNSSMPKRKLESSGSSASDQPTCARLPPGASPPRMSLAAPAHGAGTVAIDFGTAGTGFAYSFSGSDDIESKEPGGQEARKTLTNLLLDDNGNFKSFGFRARRDYFENQSGAFFANYKMVLNESSAGGPQASVRLSSPPSLAAARSFPTSCHR